MRKYEKDIKVFAVVMAALAGYVDALGYLQLGGYFVSFMSGNSTRLGVGLAAMSVQAATAASLVASFVIGVIIGSVIGRFGWERRPFYVLGCVTVLLLIAACTNTAGYSWPAVLITAAAMGAENAMFERDGEVSISLTYMTGTLVKLGQHLTAAAFGAERIAWLPYFGLWAGLVFGATIGAAVFPLVGLEGLWGAAAMATCLTIIARLLPIP